MWMSSTKGKQTTDKGNQEKSAPNAHTRINITLVGPTYTEETNYGKVYSISNNRKEKDKYLKIQMLPHVSTDAKGDKVYEQINYGHLLLFLPRNALSSELYQKSKDIESMVFGEFANIFF